MGHESPHGPFNLNGLAYVSENTLGLLKGVVYVQSGLFRHGFARQHTDCFILGFQEIVSQNSEISNRVHVIPAHAGTHKAVNMNSWLHGNNKQPTNQSAKNPRL